MKPRRFATTWLGLGAVALITFALARLAVLNVFYTTGDMRDPGWLASVTWHNGWKLHGPPAFPGPYFAEHVTPILWFTNAVSYIVPLTKFDFYAAVIGAIHALYAAGVYRAWQLTESRVTALSAGIASVVALAAAFGGVGVLALRLPHPELAIPALAVWLCIALARQAYGWAAFCCAACLLVREDAGFHVFALLVLWAGVLAWRQRGLNPEARWLLAFALVALGYSVAAFVFKRWYFPGGDVLTTSYLGSPPLHHVTARFVLERLRFLLLHRSDVTLPMLLTFLWAGINRDPLLPLGYIAAIPWLLLTLIAVHPTPGTLSYYYGFPFWLSLVWPLIALGIRRESGGTAIRRWPYAVLLAVSLIAWPRDRPIIFPLTKNTAGESPFAYTDTVRDRAQAEEFAGYFLSHRAAFGEAVFDQGAFGLVIDVLDRSAWLDPPRSGEPPDTVIYFLGGYDYLPHVLPLLRSGQYACVYAVPQTRIRLATRYPLSEDLPAPRPIIPIANFHDAPC